MRRLGLAAMLLAVACANDSANTPHAGQLVVSLTTTGTNDGAVLVLVSGGPVTTVSGSSGNQVAGNTDAQGTHIMVMGNLSAGTLVTLDIPDLSRASAYTATVEQVSDRTSFALLDPAGYKVTVGPVR